jgi:flagellar basal body-associated protein FliL
MATTDKEKMELNTQPSTNQRLKTILLVLLIVFVVLLILGAIIGFLMMSGMWGGWMMGH